MAWAAADKAVTITVDGQAQHLHTTAGTVGGAIADAGLRVSGHDVVAPGVSTKLANDTDIVVRRGRLLHLTVDGVHHDVWVTAPTAEQALADLGYNNAELESTSRSTRLPLTATSLDVLLVKHVTVIHDGITTDTTTTDEKVGQLLADLNISVAAADQLAPVAGAGLADGQQIVLRRITTANVTTTTALPFSTQQQPDATLTVGSTVVVTPGVNGTQNVVNAVTYIDGVAASQVAVSTATVTAPRAQVVRVGTKPKPAVAPGRQCPARPEQPQLGRRRQVRVEQPLERQHRQRLLRRAAVQHLDLALERRRGVRAAGRPRDRGSAEGGRDHPVRRSGLRALARLRSLSVTQATGSRVPASGNPPLEVGTRVFHPTATRRLFGSHATHALLSCDLCFREAPTVRRTYPGSSSTSTRNIRPGSFN